MKVFMVLFCYWSILHNNEFVSFLFREEQSGDGKGRGVTNYLEFQSISSY